MANMNKTTTTVTAPSVCRMWSLMASLIASTNRVNPGILTFMPAKTSLNLRATTTAPLTDEEMQAIARIDRNCRLIKGQVFLWKDNQSWEDLWDPKGETTS